MISSSPSALFYFGHCLTFEEWNQHKTNESFLVKLPLKYMTTNELKDIQRYIEIFLKGDPSENACRQLWDREGNPLIRFRGNNAYRSFLEEIRDTLPRWSPDELAAKSRATSPERRHNHKRPTG